MKDPTVREISMTSDSAVLRNERNSKSLQWVLPDSSPAYRLPLTVRNCGYSEDRRDFSVARSRSKIFAIELVTEGNLLFIQSGRSHLVEQGSAFILQKGSDHLYTPGPAGYVKRCFLGFAGTLIDLHVSELGLGGSDVCTISKPAEFERLIQRASDLLKSPLDDENVAGLALLAFESLLFFSKTIVKSRYPQPILAAIEYMQRNFSGKIVIDDLCEAANLGQSQFFHIWKGQVAATPMEYLRALRIRHAAALMEHTDLSIKEISYRVGYEDLAYFSNVFRRELGCSPRSFRRLNRNSAVIGR